MSKPIFYDSPSVFAVKHKDMNTRLASRSGGIFSALSDFILDNGGVIYGCAMTADNTAVHIRAESKQERNRMRGSKYVQSDTSNIMNAVKNDLEHGRNVLFSGTSCQIAGLRSFLQKDFENLLCVDIVCHGVPSPKVWRDYVMWQEKRNKSKCINADFRNKIDFGWNAHVETLTFENGKSVNSEIYKMLFYNHSILRPCCYYCPYKDIIHPGDISIADYWGIEKAAPGFDDNLGVSLVLINNTKGEVYFKKVEKQIEIRKCNIEDSMQLPLQRSVQVPDMRQKFWNDYEKHGFGYVAKAYGGYGFINDLKRLYGNTKNRIKSLSKD